MMEGDRPPSYGFTGGFDYIVAFCIGDLPFTGGRIRLYEQEDPLLVRRVEEEPSDLAQKLEVQDAAERILKITSAIEWLELPHRTQSFALGLDERFAVVEFRNNIIGYVEANDADVISIGR